MSCWGHDVIAYVVVASNEHHGSYRASSIQVVVRPRVGVADIWFWIPELHYRTALIRNTRIPKRMESQRVTHQCGPQKKDSPRSLQVLFKQAS